MKFIKECIPYIIVILIVVLIRTFIVTPVRVDGASMNPTLNNGDIMLLNKFDKKYKRFDIVVVNYDGTKLIKRIIGLPGEHIRYLNNKLYINNKIIKDIELDVKTDNFNIKDLNYDIIPEDCYFVMGDNRNNSTDSRIIGPINKSDVVGKTKIVLFPFNRISIVE